MELWRYAILSAYSFRDGYHGCGNLGHSPPPPLLLRSQNYQRFPLSKPRLGQTKSFVRFAYCQEFRLVSAFLVNPTSFSPDPLQRKVAVKMCVILLLGFFGFFFY